LTGQSCTQHFGQGLLRRPSSPLGRFLACNQKGLTLMATILAHALPGETKMQAILILTMILTE
jgi:hypothetical protein